MFKKSLFISQPHKKPFSDGKISILLLILLHHFLKLLKNNLTQFHHFVLKDVLTKGFLFWTEKFIEDGAET